MCAQVLIRQLNANVSRVVALYTELASLITDAPGQQQAQHQPQGIEQGS